MTSLSCTDNLDSFTGRIVTAGPAPNGLENVRLTIREVVREAPLLM